ncbi:hypothetical protein Tco_0256329 [Tanacetum coccineum]
MSWFSGCSWCGGPFNGGKYRHCTNVSFGDKFVRNPDPISYDETPNFSYPPPQPQYKIYSCELCGNNSHYGFDCPPQLPLVYEQEPCYNQNFDDDDDNDDEESTIPLNEIISQIPSSIAITPVLPTMELEDSLNMGDEYLSTIPKKESDEFIKSRRKFKIYSNPLFEFDDEYISSDVNSLFNEVSEDIESEDSYVSKLDEPDLLVTPLSKLNEDKCFDPGGDFVLEEIKACLTSDSIPTGIDDDDFDPEGDILLL